MNWYNVRPYWMSKSHCGIRLRFKLNLIFRVMRGTPSRQMRGMILGKLR